MIQVGNVSILARYDPTAWALTFDVGFERYLAWFRVRLGPFVFIMTYCRF